MRRNRLTAGIAVLLALSATLCAEPSRDAGITETTLVPDRKPGAVKARLIKRFGPARLIKVNDCRVLYLHGTHYEMGYQHGKMLAEEGRQNMDNYRAAGRVAANLSAERIREVTDRLKPHIPKRFLEEIRGLGDAAGIDPEEILRTHCITWFMHCSGAIAFGKATTDGTLYHFRSLDYGLVIGMNRGQSLQENAVLIVADPTDSGYAHCYLSWSGFVACVTGMNAKGISIGEMNSACRDESADGIPMIFMLRKLLEESATLEEALDVFRKGPRTCGYNFLVGCGTENKAAAVETSHTKCAISYANKGGDDHPPHHSAGDALVRTNHFVDPEMATLQRGQYDPGRCDSMRRFDKFTSFIEKNYGKIDGAAMVRMARLYPAEDHCLHQAIFAPGTGDMWIANATSMFKDRKAGSQNQPFYRLNLHLILKLCSPKKGGSAKAAKPEEAAAGVGK